MKSREEYVAICQTCLKGRFNSKKGLICSLTGEHAAFQTEECPDYEVQESAKRRQEAAERRKIEEMEDRKGIFSGKAGIIGGIIMIILGIAWIAVGLIFIDRFFFYPIALIIAGIISINKGVQKKAAENQQERSTVIDDHIDESLDDII